MPLDVHGLINDAEFFKLSREELRELYDSLESSEKVDLREALRTRVGGVLPGVAHEEGPTPGEMAFLGADIATAPSLAKAAARIPFKLRIRSLAKQLAEKEAKRPGPFNIPSRTLPTTQSPSPVPQQLRLPMLPPGAVPARPALEGVRAGAILRQPAEELGTEVVPELAHQTAKTLGIGGTRPNIVGGSIRGQTVSQEFIKAKSDFELARREAQRIYKEQQAKILRLRFKGQKPPGKQLPKKVEEQEQVKVLTEELNKSDAIEQMNQGVSD